jgi:hypothetical protein
MAVRVGSQVGQVSILRANLEQAARDREEALEKLRTALTAKLEAEQAECKALADRLREADSRLSFSRQQGERIAELERENKVRKGPSPLATACPPEPSTCQASICSICLTHLAYF